jgi:hypothetical protein
VGTHPKIKVWASRLGLEPDSVKIIILKSPKVKPRANLKGCHATEEVEELWKCMYILFLIKVVFFLNLYLSMI